MEARRRLRPVGHGLRAFLGRIAPPISRGLLALVRLPVALVVWLLEAASGAVAWVRPRLASVASWFGALVVRYVTPVNTVAFVGLVAAVSLGISQFMDYRGVAVGADLYEGEVGTVAPAPLRDVETAGSAHLYLLAPVALAAIALIVLTARGRAELGRVVCGLGLLGIARHPRDRPPHRPGSGHLRRRLRQLRRRAARRLLDPALLGGSGGAVRLSARPLREGGTAAPGRRPPPAAPVTSPAAPDQPTTVSFPLERPDIEHYRGAPLF